MRDETGWEGSLSEVGRTRRREGAWVGGLRKVREGTEYMGGYGVGIEK